MIDQLHNGCLWSTGPVKAGNAGDASRMERQVRQADVLQEGEPIERFEPLELEQWNVFGQCPGEASAFFPPAKDGFLQVRIQSGFVIDVPFGVKADELVFNINIPVQIQVSFVESASLVNCHFEGGVEELVEVEVRRFAKDVLKFIDQSWIPIKVGDGGADHRHIGVGHLGFWFCLSCGDAETGTWVGGGKTAADGFTHDRAEIAHFGESGRNTDEPWFSWGAPLLRPPGNVIQAMASADLAGGCKVVQLEKFTDRQPDGAGLEKREVLIFQLDVGIDPGAEEFALRGVGKIVLLCAFFCAEMKGLPAFTRKTDPESRRFPSNLACGRVAELNPPEGASRALKDARHKCARVCPVCLRASTDVNKRDGKSRFVKGCEGKSSIRRKTLQDVFYCKCLEWYWLLGECAFGVPWFGRVSIFFADLTQGIADFLGGFYLGFGKGSGAVAGQGGGR